MKPKTRVRVIAITVLGVLGTVFITALARRETPKAATLTDLNSTEPLKRRLQQDADKVTLIALVSPVCPRCRHGFTDIQSVLKNVSDDRLRVYIVFLPMYPGDNKSRAQSRAEPKSSMMQESVITGNWFKSQIVSWKAYILSINLRSKRTTKLRLLLRESRMRPARRRGLLIVLHGTTHPAFS
jgi:hypothetical protein